MARDEFLDNVRDAVALAVPLAEADSDALQPANVARLLRRPVTWLTPKSVEGYDPHDFDALDAERRKQLDTSVRAFEKVVKKVPANAPVSDEQIHAGWDKFHDVISILRDVVRDEWTKEVTQLVEQAAEWCRARGWIAKKKVKQLRDKFLGPHEANQLHFHTLENHFLLEPIARYVVGASGLLELNVLPVCESVMITRANGKWYIHAPRGEGKRREWSERAFVEAVEKLSSLA